MNLFFSVTVLMNLDDKTTKRMLIGGLVIIIIVIFVVWRWRSKSTYVYPEATTTPPLGSVAVSSVVSTAETASTPYYLTVTTASAHGFVSTTSARDTVIFTGFTTSPKTALNGPSKQFILYTVPSATTFTILVPPSIIASGTSVSGTDAGASVQSGFNYYQNKLQDAVNQYNINTTNSNLGIYLAGSTKAASDLEASNVKQAAFTTASTEYVRNKCPYSWTGTVAAPNPYLDSSSKPTIAKDPANTAYALYKTTTGEGISKISAEYNDFFNSTSTAAVQGSNYYLNQTAVQQARRADITGATREYLGSVCPGFYTDTTGSGVEAIYKGWGPGATPYGFTKPTSTQINVWASYAIDSSIANSVNSDGKLVLSLARDLKGQPLTAGGITAKSPIVGVTTLIPDATIIASGNLGNYSGIVSVVGNGTLVTVTTSLAHGLATGASVIMTGFVPAALNGTYTITVTSTTVFTYSSTSGTATTFGTITPLVAATTTTSPQMIVYTYGSGATAVSKPAWQWARDYGPGTVATTLLPSTFQGWATGAPASTTSMMVDTNTYTA